MGEQNSFQKNTSPSKTKYFYIAIFLAIFLAIILTPSMFPCFFAANIGAKFVLIKGKTRLDVAKEYKPKFDAIAEKFALIDRLLPPKGEAIEYRPSNLDPIPIFDRKENIYNTEIVKYEQLLKPRLRSYQVDYFPYINTDEHLIDCMSETNLDDKFSGMMLWGNSEPACGLEKEYEEVLKYRYLVVFRLLEYQRALARGTEVVSTGSVKAECFLVNLENPRILASFLLEVTPTKTAKINNLENLEPSQPITLKQAAFLQFRYTYPSNNRKTPTPYVPPKRTPQEDLRSSLENNLFQEVEKNFLQKLREVTQGTFRSAYD